MAREACRKHLGMHLEKLRERNIALPHRD